jgi:hypothetical protein
LLSGDNIAITFDKDEAVKMAPLCLAIAVLMGGCAITQKAPVTGRTQLILIGQEEENRLGLSEAEEILKNSKRSIDKALTERVVNVGITNRRRFARSQSPYVGFLRAGRFYDQRFRAARRQGVFLYGHFETDGERRSDRLHDGARDSARISATWRGAR